MANIRKIQGKNGVSYKITVTSGRDLNGKQMRHYMTWAPDSGMTVRQTEKELQRVAFEFEQKIEMGFAVDNRQTFAEYAEYVIDLKERNRAKRRTIDRYRELMRRIRPAIGHIKLTELKPQHLNAFYKNLGEVGIRENGDRARAKNDLAEIIKSRKFSRAKIAAISGLSASTVGIAARGESVFLDSAKRIAQVIGEDVGDLFIIERSTDPLSNKTIVEYHRLISTILTQAEKEMLVMFNAASKATPPKLQRKEAETFQPEEIEKIRDCLESEPLKWKTLTHLLMITGARRGEVVGLEWSKIDWEHSQVLIDKALLYSTLSGVYADSRNVYPVLGNTHTVFNQITFYKVRTLKICMFFLVRGICLFNLPSNIVPLLSHMADISNLPIN